MYLIFFRVAEMPTWGANLGSQKRGVTEGAEGIGGPRGGKRDENEQQKEEELEVEEDQEQGKEK